MIIISTRILLLILLSNSLYAQWTKTKGPTGGDVTDITTIPGFIFANSGPAGIFRSSDDGITWSAANNGLPEYPHCYALTSSGSALYASIYQSGIYTSIDNGQTWTPVNNGISNKTFSSLFVSGDEIYTGSEGFYYSSNKGVSWVERPVFFGQGQVRDFVLTDGKLFAAVNGGVGTYGIFVSSDKGLSWTQLDLPGITNVNAIAAFDNAIYITGGQPTHISRDYGVTWSTSDIGTTGYHILSAIHAIDDKVYIGAGNSTIYYSENEGVDFSTITSLPYTGQVASINVVNNTLFVGGKKGVYASSDNAATWTEQNTGLVNQIITSLVVDDSYVYAGTNHQGIFVSADNGETWTERNEGLADNSEFNYLNGIQPLGIHVSNGEVVMGLRKGLYKSTNNGETWVSQLSIADNSLTGLIGKEEKVVAFGGAGQYYSINNGDNWITRNDNVFSGVHIQGGMIKGDTIILLSDNNNLKHVFISKNFGDSWDSYQISPNVFSTTDVQYSNSKMFVSTRTGLYVSGDFGITWSTTGSGLPTEITALVARESELYAGTVEGVFVSYNQGNQWYPVNDGFSTGDASPLVFNDTFVFSGSYGNSVWSSPIDGLNVIPVCTGIDPGLTLLKGESLTITLDDLTVVDPDNNFPGDFTMTILPGDNYTVSGNVVTPDSDFDGDLSVRIIVSDGRNNSSVFTATIGVVVSIEREVNDRVSLYPNPAGDVINISFSSDTRASSYCVRDYLGRIVIDQSKTSGLEKSFSIGVSQLPQGLYFLETYPQRLLLKFLKK